MNYEALSYSVIVGDERYSVHWERTSKTVTIYPLPEFLPQSLDERRRLAIPLAAGRWVDGDIVWSENTLGERAAVATARLRAQLLEEDGLLLFVDETGDEALGDDGHPLFGLGGCAVRVGDYHHAIVRPWSELKARVFGDHRARMHATEFDRKHAPAMAEFFRDAPIFRIAAFTHRATQLIGHWGVYEATAGMLLRNLAALLSRTRVTAVTTVFESSERGDRLARRFFPLTRAQGPKGEIPLRWALQSKAAGEPGLEVADFVMHAAGGQIRSGGTRERIRADFRVVFQPEDPTLVEFTEVTKFELRHNPEGTIDGVLIDPTTQRVPEDDG